MFLSCFLSLRLHLILNMSAPLSTIHLQKDALIIKNNFVNLNYILNSLILDLYFEADDQGSIIESAYKMFVRLVSDCINEGRNSRKYTHSI